MKQQHSTVYIIKILFCIIVSTILVDKITYFSLVKISNQVLSGESIGKLNQFLQIKDKVEFLIFGSSRARNHISPQLISNSSFNMGMGGTHIAYANTLIKLLSDKEQLILIHIDPHHAFDKKYSANDINRLKIKYNQNKIIKSEIDKISSNVLNKIYWSLDYNGKVLGILKNYFIPSYNHYNFFGYVALNQRPEVELSKLMNNSLKECDRKFILNNYYEKYLKDLKEISKKQNKTIIFYTSPMFTDYCKEDNLMFEKIMEEMNFKYYDFTDIFQKESNLSYWYDRSHLSDFGAKEFTKIIQLEINEFNILKE